MRGRSTTCACVERAPLNEADAYWEMPTKVVALVGQTELHDQLVAHVPPSAHLRMVSYPMDFAFTALDKEPDRDHMHGALLRRSWFDTVHTSCPSLFCLVVHVKKSIPKQELKGYLESKIAAYRQINSMDKLVVLLCQDTEVVDSKVLSTLGSTVGLDQCSDFVLIDTSTPERLEQDMQRLIPRLNEASSEFYRGQIQQWKKHFEIEIISGDPRLRLATRFCFYSAYLFLVCNEEKQAVVHFEKVLKLLKHLDVTEENCFEVKNIAFASSFFIIAHHVRCQEACKALRVFRSLHDLCDVILVPLELEFRNFAWKQAAYILFADMLEKVEDEIGQDFLYHPITYLQSAYRIALERRENARTMLQSFRSTMQENTAASYNKKLNQRLFFGRLVNYEITSLQVLRDLAEEETELSFYCESMVNHEEEVIRILLRMQSLAVLLQRHRMNAIIAADLAREYIQLNLFEDAWPLFANATEFYRQHKWTHLLSSTIPGYADAAAAAGKLELACILGLEYLALDTCDESTLNRIVHMLRNQSAALWTEKPYSSLNMAQFDVSLLSIVVEFNGRQVEVGSDVSFILHVTNNLAVDITVLSLEPSIGNESDAFQSTMTMDTTLVPNETVLVHGQVVAHRCVDDVTISSINASISIGSSIPLVFTQEVHTAKPQTYNFVSVIPCTHAAQLDVDYSHDAIAGEMHPIRVSFSIQHTEGHSFGVSYTTRAGLGTDPALVSRRFSDWSEAREDDTEHSYAVYRRLDDYVLLEPNSILELTKSEMSGSEAHFEEVLYIQSCDAWKTTLSFNLLMDQNKIMQKRISIAFLDPFQVHHSILSELTPGKNMPSHVGSEAFVLNTVLTNVTQHDLTLVSCNPVLNADVDLRYISSLASSPTNLAPQDQISLTCMLYPTSAANSSLGHWKCKWNRSGSEDEPCMLPINMPPISRCIDKEGVSCHLPSCMEVAQEAHVSVHLEDFSQHIDLHYELSLSSEFIPIGQSSGAVLSLSSQPTCIPFTCLPLASGHMELGKIRIKSKATDSFLHTYPLGIVTVQPARVS